MKSLASTIKFKTMAILMLVIVVIVSVANYLSVRDAVTYERTSMTKNADLLAAIQADAAAGPMWDFNYGQLENLLKAMSNMPGFHAVMITDAKGKTLSEIPATADDGHELLVVEKEIIRKENSEKLGTLKLELSTKLLVERTEQMMMDAFIKIAMMILVLGAFSYVVLDLIITRPLSGMTRVMQRLAGGDTNVVVPSSSRNDEIGEMAKTVEVFKKNAQEKIKLQKEQELERERAKEATKQEIDRITAEILSAAKNASMNMSVVASATAELASSIDQITTQMDESGRITTNAVQNAQKTNQTVDELRDVAERIDSIVRMIQVIADQTNLLALNASIEAARAGDAGRGFSVVADEVKNLSSSTSNATKEISELVNLMKTSSQNTVHAMTEISQTINTINDITSAVVNAVREQRIATNDIANSMGQASSDTDLVAERIEAIRRAAGE